MSLPSVPHWSTAFSPSASNSANVDIRPKQQQQPPPQQPPPPPQQQPSPLIPSSAHTAAIAAAISNNGRPALYTASPTTTQQVLNQQPPPPPVRLGNNVIIPQTAAAPPPLLPPSTVSAPHMQQQSPITTAAQPLSMQRSPPLQLQQLPLTMQQTAPPPTNTPPHQQLALKSPSAGGGQVLRTTSTLTNGKLHTKEFELIHRQAATTNIKYLNNNNPHPSKDTNTVTLDVRPRQILTTTIDKTTNSQPAAAAVSSSTPPSTPLSQHLIHQHQQPTSLPPSSSNATILANQQQMLHQTILQQAQLQPPAVGTHNIVTPLHSGLHAAGALPSNLASTTSAALTSSHTHASVGAGLPGNQKTITGGGGVSSAAASHSTSTATHTTGITTLSSSSTGTGGPTSTGAGGLPSTPATGNSAAHVLPSATAPSSAYVAASPPAMPPPSRAPVAAAPTLSVSPNTVPPQQVLSPETPRLTPMVVLLSLEGFKAPVNGVIKKHTNQDRGFIHEVSRDFTVFAVFDGHGEHGHDVAQFVSSSFRNLLVQDFPRPNTLEADRVTSEWPISGLNSSNPSSSSQNRSIPPRYWAGCDQALLEWT